MGKSSNPPAPPDYVGAAYAQGAANKDTALTSGKINNPNVVSPYGTQTVTWNGEQPTLTQTLSPEQQAIFSQQQGNQLGLGTLAQQGIGTAKGIIGQPVDLSKLSAMPADSQTLRNQMIDAAMSRVNEDYGRAQDQKQADLVAAGIPVGSKAYNDQMQLLQRGVNDARQQAILNAGSAAQQAFNMDLGARQQGLNEQYGQSSYPLNQITALMSGSQVSSPFNMPGYAQNAQVAPAPVFQAANALGNYNTDVWNAQQANQSNQMNGLMGLGGTAIMGGMMF